MRKVFVVLMLVVCFVGLASCGNEQQPNIAGIYIGMSEEDFFASSAAKQYEFKLGSPLIVVQGERVYLADTEEITFAVLIKNNYVSEVEFKHLAKGFKHTLIAITPLRKVSDLLAPGELK